MFYQSDWFTSVYTCSLCSCIDKVKNQVNAKVKSNQESYKEYNRLVHSAEFREELRQAIKDPKSKVAEKVLSKLLPMMNICTSKNSYFGTVASNDTEVKIRNMIRRYGPASILFLTLAPDDINNPMAFRLSLRQPNADVARFFPCKWTGTGAPWTAKAR